MSSRRYLHFIIASIASLPFIGCSLDSSIRDVASTSLPLCADGKFLVSTAGQWVCGDLLSAQKMAVGTTTPSEFQATIGGDGSLLAQGQIGYGTSLTTSGAGTRMFWYPKKAAFRAGVVSGNTWDDAFVGYGSAAFGAETQASGLGSMAMGDRVVASGASSIALGSQTTASGLYSTAIGFKSTASGIFSLAIGIGTTAPAYGQMSLGQYNTISTPTTSNWLLTDPLFIIGNGLAAGSESNALVILKNGHMGVGSGTVSPSYTLDVLGDINSSTLLRVAGISVCTSTGCVTSSDRRLKENILPLENSLSKILKLQGVSYAWKDKKKFRAGEEVGFVAQDVEKIFPEVVRTDSETGLKAIAYASLVAPLIEAFKELYHHENQQDQALEILKNENLELKKYNATLEQRLVKIEKELKLRAPSRH